MLKFVKTSLFPVPVDELFDWHAREGAFTRLNPPWEPVEVVSAEGGIRDGARVHIKVPILGPCKISWRLGHKDYIDHRQFRDYQVQGPFKSWEHTHSFKNISTSSAELTDDISFSLPVPFFGDLFGGWIVKKKLTKLFEYRHHVTKNDLQVIQKYRDALPAGQRILLTGASGLVGTTLGAFLSCAGHSVFSLVRHTPRNTSEIFWNPKHGELNKDSIEGFDFIIHLAGENIAQRWTKDKKRRILESRTLGTTLLYNTIAKLSKKPKAVLQASAIGYYGNRGDKVCDEQTELGTGFLADVCKEWERPTHILVENGVRSVLMRFGIVLSPVGGALQKMLLPFRLGLGGHVGDGKPYMSWILIDDLCYALYHCMAEQTIEGAVNITAPEPVTNRDFSKTLASVLKRPAIFPVPAFILKLLFGQMADETILSSTRVIPKKLLDSGFTFTFPDLRKALSHIL